MAVHLEDTIQCALPIIGITIEHGKNKTMQVCSAGDWQDGAKVRCDVALSCFEPIQVEEAWIDETCVNRGLERDRHIAEREPLAVAAGPSSFT